MRIMRKIIFILIVLFLAGIVVKGAFAQHAYLSGTWYSSNPAALRKELQGYLDQVKLPKIYGKVVGLMAPHAGYKYSGPVAAYSYKIIEYLAPQTIVIVGFTHRFHRRGQISVFTSKSFITPFGAAWTDKALVERLIEYDDNISYLEGAFVKENAIEMMVPFAQMVSPDSRFVIIAICDQKLETARLLGDALYNVLKDEKDFILLASTDCSHYLTYDEANKLDAHTIRYLKENDPDKFYKESFRKKHELMCGPGAVYGVMSACKRLGANEVEILKHANSGDTSGYKDRVVGYLSAAFVKTGTANVEKKVPEKEEGEMFSAGQKKELLKIARDTIRHYLETGKKLEVLTDDEALKQEMGAFVTLHRKGQLRGCIGHMVASGPLDVTVRDMAIAAAVQDPRFKPLTSSELDEVDIEISALSPMKQIEDYNTIEMGKHGVLVKKGFRSGVYLPQVATETGWDRDEFMNSLCMQKAGIPADSWKNGEADIYVFTAEVFGEKDE